MTSLRTEKEKIALEILRCLKFANKLTLSQESRTKILYALCVRYGGSNPTLNGGGLEEWLTQKAKSLWLEGLETHQLYMNNCPRFMHALLEESCK